MTIKTLPPFDDTSAREARDFQQSNFEDARTWSKVDTGKFAANYEKIKAAKNQTQHTIVEELGPDPAIAMTPKQMVLNDIKDLFTDLKDNKDFINFKKNIWDNPKRLSDNDKIKLYKAGELTKMKMLTHYSPVGKSLNVVRYKNWFLKFFGSGVAPAINMMVDAGLLSLPEDSHGVGKEEVLNIETLEKKVESLDKVIKFISPKLRKYVQKIDNKIVTLKPKNYDYWLTA